MGLVSRVEDYYREKGISPAGFKNFGCPYKQDKPGVKGCVNCASSPSKFVCGKEALVTSGYEKHALPRLLILSAESGRETGRPSRRKAVALREWEEHQYDPEEGKRTSHWHEVHQIAWHILRCFKSDLEMKHTRYFIAHTNSAKCCVNNKHKSQGRPVLFDNCREYIGSELELLRPDILVTQGDQAERAVKDHFANVLRRRLLVRRSDRKTKREKWYRAEITIHGRRVLWLRTPHPGARPQLSAAELDKLYERCVGEVYQWRKGFGGSLKVRPRVLLDIVESMACY